MHAGKSTLGLVFVFASAAAPSAADAVGLNNGDPVGPNYTISGIDAGVTVDFAATAPLPANNGTIGKLTVTMGHANLASLGFTLTQNGPAAVTGSASAGLRLLIDVADTNNMTDPWLDYHIHAEDNAEDVNAIRQTIVPTPSESGHLIDAHFHDTTAGFGSSPLVIQGSADNVVDLNYGLGNVVAAGGTFTASNILLHERDFIGFTRTFDLDFAPSVPEPATAASLLVLGAAAALRRRR